MSYECSDEGTYTQNINNLSIRSHPLEEENRTKCKLYSLQGNLQGSIDVLNFKKVDIGRIY